MDAQQEDLKMIIWDLKIREAIIELNRDQFGCFEARLNYVQSLITSAVNNGYQLTLLERITPDYCVNRCGTVVSLPSRKVCKKID